MSYWANVYIIQLIGIDCCDRTLMLIKALWNTDSKGPIFTNEFFLTYQKTYKNMHKDHVVNRVWASDSNSYWIWLFYFFWIKIRYHLRHFFSKEFAKLVQKRLLKMYDYSFVKEDCKVIIIISNEFDYVNIWYWWKLNDSQIDMIFGIWYNRPVKRLNQVCFISDKVFHDPSIDLALHSE